MTEPVTDLMENLASYLNDHLAGSVAALELLDRLIKVYPDDTRASFFLILRHEVEQDQRTLQDLMKKLGAEESTTRKAGAWFTEKLMRGKIQPGDSSDGQLGLLLALETLVLGITGKQALWRSLAAASQDIPPLAGVDYVSLEKRATDQRDRVECERIHVARSALGQGWSAKETESRGPIHSSVLESIRDPVP
jgi:hypothetical protein